MAAILSFASFKRAPVKLDWSSAELAEFYRVQDAIARIGLRVETDSGVSDENDPWFVFCSGDTGEVMVHFARIDGYYVVASPMLPSVLRGLVFRDVIDQFLAAQPVLLTPSVVSNGPRRVFMHPSALLTALVLTIYLLFDAQREVRADQDPDAAPSAGGADQQPGARLLAHIQNQLASEGQGRSVAERLLPHTTFVLVAFALAHDREFLAAVGMQTGISADAAGASEAHHPASRDSSVEAVISSDAPAQERDAAARSLLANHQDPSEITGEAGQAVVQTAAQTDDGKPEALAEGKQASAPVTPASLPASDGEAVPHDIYIEANLFTHPRFGHADDVPDNTPVRSSSAEAEFAAILFIVHASGRVEFKPALADHVDDILRLFQTWQDGRDKIAMAALNGTPLNDGSDPADSGLTPVVDHAQPPSNTSPQVVPVEPITPAPVASTPSVGQQSDKTPMLVDPPQKLSFAELVSRFIQLAGNAEFVVDRGNIIIFDPDVFALPHIGSMTIKQYEFADGSDITLVGLAADIFQLV